TTTVAPAGKVSVKGRVRKGLMLGPVSLQGLRLVGVGTVGREAAEIYRGRAWRIASASVAAPKSSTGASLRSARALDAVRSTRLKPSLAASLRRVRAALTERSSPASPTSPKAATSEGIATSENAETAARATARSAAGSPILRPPTTLQYTSWWPSGSP